MVQDMKLNRLETHDRLEHLKKDQSLNIFQGTEDCLKKNPLSLAIQEKSPYVYMFAHARTANDGVNKVLYWQPRLSRPEPQDNSYLFRAISKTDQIEICWIIPAKVLWNQYKKGNVTEHAIVNWSIDQYENHFKDLSEKHSDDFSEERAKQIYHQIVQEHAENLKSKPKRATLEVF